MLLTIPPEDKTDQAMLVWGTVQHYIYRVLYTVINVSVSVHSLNPVNYGETPYSAKLFILKLFQICIYIDRYVKVAIKN